MEDRTLNRLGQFAPDIMNSIEIRALLVSYVSSYGPIGRRQLAEKMKLPEREVRSLANLLRQQEIISFQTNGMALTPKGEKLLPFAKELTQNMRKIGDMEEKLAKQLGITQVHIALGNADEAPEVLNALGALAAKQLAKYLRKGSILAVTGGSTIAQVAKHLPQNAATDIMVVPARGGMGRNVAHQANTLAAEFGKKLGGQYRLMHLPDQMDAYALQEMLRLPEVKETLDLLQKADVILHGVGRADEMAQSRNLPQKVLEQLVEKKAVAESFGYYFDQQGKFLYAASSIGVDLSRLNPRCDMIAVAAGTKKAKALLAVLRHYRHEMLVTDEGGAREMLALLS